MSLCGKWVEKLQSSHKRMWWTHTVRWLECLHMFWKNTCARTCQSLHCNKIEFNSTIPSSFGTWSVMHLDVLSAPPWLHGSWLSSSLNWALQLMKIWTTHCWLVDAASWRHWLNNWKQKLGLCNLLSDSDTSVNSMINRRAGLFYQLLFESIPPSGVKCLLSVSSKVGTPEVITKLYPIEILLDHFELQPASNLVGPIIIFSLISRFLEKDIKKTEFSLVGYKP